jgi:RNA polymerase sigma-70 factor (ECF subfamily)
VTDPKFINSILAGGSVMHRTIEWFYHENFNLVYKMTGAHKLIKEEALDAYSDAVTAFVENIRNNKFRGEAKCSTYFIRIFNNKCIDIIRKKTTNRVDKNTISLDDLGTELIQEAVNEDQNIDLTDFTGQLSQICREVLMDWSDGYSMEEIAARNKLKNAHTARSKRFNCFKQLITILQRNNIVDANINMIPDGEQL